MFNRIFATILPVLINSVVIKHQECQPNPNSQIISVEINPCKRDPCKLKQGTTYSMTVNFKANTDSSSLTSKVCGYVGPVCIPFPLPQPDACQELVCPIEAGQEYSYTTSLPIRSEYPVMKVKGRWTMVNQDKSEMLCFYMNLKIVKGDGDKIRFEQGDDEEINVKGLEAHEMDERNVKVMTVKKSNN